MTKQETIILYRNYSRRLFNSSLRIVGSSEIAEELMHDALLKYINGKVTCGSSAQESSYLTTTVIRMSIDYIRKKRREALFLEDWTLNQSEIDTSTEFEDSLVEDIAKVKKAILEMPPPYGLILNLVLLEGLEYDEIAEVTGEKEATLRCQFSRGKQKLIEKLRQG